MYRLVAFSIANPSGPRTWAAAAIGWPLLASLAFAPTPARADDLFLPPDPAAVTALDELESAEAAVGAAPTTPATDFDVLTVRRRVARLDRGLLERARAAAASGTAPAGLLEVNLFDNAGFTVTDLRTAPTSAGFSITGNLEGVPFGRFAIVVNGEEIAGEVDTPFADYSIERGADGHVVIREVDRSPLPEGAEPLEARPGPDPPPGVAPPAFPLGTNGPRAAAAPPDPPFVVSPQSQTSEIDVLMLYTPAALAREGSRASLETKIDLWFTTVNRIFADSGVNAEISLALAAEVDYEETAGSLDLTRLRLPADGFMDEAHTLRDAVGADLVHLVEGESWYCGFAYVMQSISSSFASFGFGATNVACGSNTFAHELGHNMGLNHDRYQSNLERVGGFSNTPHVGSYGYVNLELLRDANPDSDVAWITIMSYSTMCRRLDVKCGEIAYFSTPDILFSGTNFALGVVSTADSSLIAGPADAVHTLNISAPVVAAFRTRPTGAPAVSWLRRTTEEAAITSLTPLVPGATVADTLGWRIAFTKEVRNVSADDFELAGSGFGSPTLTVSARSGSQRAYDISASGGTLASFTGDVELGLASSQNIEDLSGQALSSTWPAGSTTRRRSPPSLRRPPAPRRSSWPLPGTKPLPGLLRASPPRAPPSTGTT